MGSSRAALTAGQRPKVSPTPTAVPKAISTQVGCRRAGNGEKALIRKARPPPMPMPRRPPAPVRVMASVRNCQRMSRRVAPRALRTPISRVLSVTETSMMFISPTPPTSRPIEEMAFITR